MSLPPTIKRTPLYDQHVALGAKVIDFGGWAMPVNYPGGILDEHKAVRSSAGVFDVSHMGEVEFRGPRAAEAVQKLVTNDVAKLSDGKAMYTVACRPSGGIVDDLIVYREKADQFLIVVNAGNIDKDVAWFREQTTLCEVTDMSNDYGLLAVQGPKAVALVRSLAEAPVDQLPSFGFTRCPVAGIPAGVARTGYTGEDGFELFVGSGRAAELWNRLLDAGAKPIG